MDTREVLRKARQRALSGGLPGAAAMGLQVTSMMWLRTTVNYQYATGTGTREALRALYAEGGVRRFYRGLAPALVQGPLSRFGDTAANAGVLALLDSYDETRGLPVAAKTAAASCTAAGWRVALMPVDTFKTTMQVHGAGGAAVVLGKVRARGPRVLYHGALASAGATVAGHFPWFATYNAADAWLPEQQERLPRLCRSALMGFAASAASDCVSNAARVVKTARQTALRPLPYTSTVRRIVAQEGVLGLMGRGLKTRLLSNGVQGVCFAVVWKELQAALEVPS